MLAMILMVMDKQVVALSQLRSALSLPLAPLQYLVSRPIEWIDALRDTITTHDALIRENLNLKAEQLLLKAQLQRYVAIELENNELKALRNTSSQLQVRTLIGQLLSVSSDPFSNQVVLNKGSKDNVFIGQPVLDANGVMGQVIQVGPLTSRILLISDAHSGVPVQVVRNGLRAIAVGDPYSGKLRLLNITQTTDIQVGDRLITSGLGTHYPEGYPVGKVISVIKDPTLQFSSVIVEPAAHLNRSRGVLLIWPNDGTVS